MATNPVDERSFGAMNPAPTAGTGGGLPMVLFVDDEPMVLDALRDQFRRQFSDRYDVELAQSASEALEIVQEALEDGVTIPVIVSDHIMPGMKGDELLVQLHGLLPRTRKILLTGQAGLDAVQRAVNEADLYRYIPKPWDRHDFELTVRGAIEAYLAELEVERQRARLVATNAAASRFVPYEFLAVLGRRDLTEVSRADCALQDVTVFFSDIREFSTLVEGLTPRENLDWINEYLAAMEPPVLQNHGFVDNIIGDAILALFGRSADDGVRAGIAAQAALASYNEVRVARGDDPLRVGIGLNTGPILLGVYGGAERLKCGVVGDPVNLASRIEGLTKRIGTMLISADTRAALVDPSAYQMRYVDKVVVKGRSVPTELYEVLDGLGAEEAAQKLAHREPFEAAVRTFQAGDVAAAERAFLALEALCPLDLAVPWYLQRCRRLASQGVPEGWDGVVHLEEK
ncbi:MAG: response regulator [Deltaproteobacteria bacterium]|nr:response regulator [Deltaproteobacteria bacterium]